MPSLAGANLAFYVDPSTGNDANPGTSAQPFKTASFAVATVAGFDYGYQYFPTINLKNGNYTGVQQILPQLLNCPLGGVITGNTTTPTNVTVADSGSAPTFTVLGGALWSLSGISFTGTYAGVQVNAHGYCNLNGKLDFAGNFSRWAFGNAFLSTISAFGADITVSASSMGALILSGGVINLDSASIDFVNPITFSNYVVNLDDGGAFFAFDGGASFTNAGNVTMSGGAPGLLMTNGAFFEANAGSKVDGNVLTRANFPGAGSGAVSIDATSTFQPDNVSDYDVTLANFVTLNKRMQIIPDAAITDTGAMFNLIATFSNAAANFIGSYLQITKTASAGGNQDWFQQWVVGGSGIVAAVRYDGTMFGSQFVTNDIATAALVDSSQGGAGLQLAASGTVVWSGSGAFYNTHDLSLSRSGAGVLAIGNGSAGNGSGAILAKTKAGAFTTSDVPLGAWLCGRDTTNNTTKMYYNNAGTLMSVALT